MSRYYGFASGSEPPRRFSEILAERQAVDPDQQVRSRAIEGIARLEGEAAEAAAAGETGKAKTLQCEAEGLRAALEETAR